MGGSVQVPKVWGGPQDPTVPHELLGDAGASSPRSQLPAPPLRPFLAAPGALVPSNGSILVAYVSVLGPSFTESVK